MNGFDYSTNTTSEDESMSDNERMFLYARAVHSNHSIQYHMHQIMERQKVIDEYRNMTMEGLDLIPLESNLHRYHPVIISQIINMIELDNFCHHQTFESVKSNLRNMWSEGIQELENARIHCTDGDKNNNEMDGIEVMTYAVLVGAERTRFLREKIAQCKKVRTNRNTMKQIKRSPN